MSDTAEKTKKNSKAGIVVFILILIAVIALVGISSYSQLTASETIESSSTPSWAKKIIPSFGKAKTVKPAPSGDYIAKLYITGVIQQENKTYNQKWLLDTIKELKDDPSNKGIILYIDSPGGTVYESDEVYLALNDYQISRKPVWAYMAGMACSGAYYISCSAQTIVANRNTLTGSIGVIAGQAIDMTELLANIGIKSKTFTAGRNKNMGAFDNPLTEEQEAIMQSIADECYAQFTKIVSINRKLDLEKVQEIADGRIYTANQALENKLIDSVDTFDKAFSQFKLKNKLSECELVDFEYTYEPSIWEMLYGKAGVFTTISKSREEVLLEKITPSLNYPAYIYQR